MLKHFLGIFRKPHNEACDVCRVPEEGPQNPCRRPLASWATAEHLHAHLDHYLDYLEGRADAGHVVDTEVPGKSGLVYVLQEERDSSYSSKKMFLLNVYLRSCEVLIRDGNSNSENDYRFESRNMLAEAETLNILQNANLYSSLY